MAISKQQKQRLAWLILGLWVIVIIALQWSWFQSNYRSFLHEAATKIDESLQFDDGETLRFIHFHDPECICSSIGQTHVSTVVNAHEDAEHHYITPDNQLNTTLGQVNNWAISSPSIAIVKKNGQFLYYGPYTDGAICGLGLNLIDVAISQNERNTDFSWFNLLSDGCFCPWPSL